MVRSLIVIVQLHAIRSVLTGQQETAEWATRVLQTWMSSTS